jgi:hypothetical protein
MTADVVLFLISCVLILLLAIQTAFPLRVT